VSVLAALDSAGRVKSEVIHAAATRLRAGELVAFPTETVYGLGADARNPEAVRKIFSAKGRPADHPLIVHLATASEIEAWAIEISAEARALAQAFWPGPMTLILKRAAHVSNAVTGAQDTVGLRVPSHPVARALLAACSGVAAPSANRFGRVSPTQAQHVVDEFANENLMILDGGACEVGIESTIIDCTATPPRILRPGAITQADVARLLNSGHEKDDARVRGELAQEAQLSMVSKALPASSVSSPRVSGSLDSHYAPATPTTLVPAHELSGVIKCGDAVFAPARPVAQSRVHYVPAPRDARAYARVLYASLRTLDALNAPRIIIEMPPADAAWAGVNDRLKRASFRE
jgi:L-threonylcarbamoyladenylate synthase